MSTPGDGWYPDPTGRHQLRYWTGAAWSAQVSDHGQVSVDQPVMPPLADLPIAHPVSPTNVAPVPPVPPPAIGELPMPPAPPPPPVVAAPPPPKVVAWATVLGAMIAGVATLISWFDFGGVVSLNAFDVPFAFLFDRNTVDDSSLSVGLVTVVVAALALLAGFVRSARVMGRIMGGLLVAIGAAFGVQLIQMAGVGDISVTDLAGWGPVVAIVGGVMVLVTSHR